MYIDEKSIYIITRIGVSKLKVGSNYQINLDEYLNWSLGHTLQDVIFNRRENSLTSFYTKLCLNQTIKEIKQNKYFIPYIGKKVLINKHYISNYK